MADPTAATAGLCSFDGCDRKHWGRGWCKRHYNSWRKYGTPLPPPRGPEIRFWNQINIQEPGECWLWLGSTDRDGYGRIHANSRNGLVHRFAFELLVGPIPEGLELDHLCRVRHCVNPEHLETVTHRKNTLRGNAVTARRARQTHCVHGHPFDETNTYIRPSGGRACRACNRRRSTGAAVLGQVKRRA